MKDVLFKAGEIDTDGLEQWVDSDGTSTRKTTTKSKTGGHSWMSTVNTSWSGNDTLEEDDSSQLSENETESDSSSDDVKPVTPPVVNKIKPRLTATVIPPRYLPPMRRPTEKPKPILKPVIRAVAVPPPPPPVSVSIIPRHAPLAGNFRIPKKTTTSTNNGLRPVVVKQEPMESDHNRVWTDEENSASQVLVSLAAFASGDSRKTPMEPPRRPRKQKMPRSRSINSLPSVKSSEL